MAYSPQNPNGQAVMASSAPVVIASNQSAIPVSGPVTDTQLRATALPVSLASDADNTSTGTLTAAAQTVILTMGGKSAGSASITGTWVGTITFEGTVDGTTWNSINAVAASTSQPQPTTTVNGLYRLSPAGLLQIRANMTAFTSGSVSVSMRASAGTGGVFVNQILPTKITDGTNTATIKGASTAAVATDLPVVVALHPSSPTPNFLAAQAVTGTFFQATQPVSAVALPLPTGASTETTLAALNTKVTAVNTGAVTISTALPTGANTIGAVTVTGTGGVTATKASATPAATTDISQVVALSPNSPAFLKSADLGVTVTAIAGAIATLTLPAPAAGLFHYITRVEMSCYTTAARTGAATPLIVTSTNLPGTPSWDFSTAAAVGTTERIIFDDVSPLKSSVAATATTIVGPATASVIWKIKASYYTA